MSAENSSQTVEHFRAMLLARMRADVLAYLDKMSERWHAGVSAAQGLQLREFLGLTEAEYALYTLRPDLMLALLPAIPAPAEQSPVRYLTKPAVVDAVQWFAMGDHPAVVMAQKASCNGVIICAGPGVLGYDLQVPAVRTKLGWREVAPGNWIVTDRAGEATVWAAEDFAAAFDRVG